MLENWETYEKMLSEFNSDNAIGSAMDEAEKSANNWVGSINKVKNSWAELTSKFADSDNMISVINSVNAIIQSLGDSATTGALRTLSDTFAGIFKTASVLTDKLGALPTLLTTIATINSIRGKGIFGDKSFSNFGDAIQKANSSLKNYIVSLDAAKIKTIGLKAATVAFEAALTLGMTFAISKLLEAFNKFSRAEELAVEQEKEIRQGTVESIRAYNQEIQESQELSVSYMELVSTTSDLTTEKEKLLNVQEKINKGISDQTDKVDLLNKSLSENVELIAKQRLEEAKRVVSENQATYESIVTGEKASYSAMQTYGDKDVSKAVSEIEIATGRRVSGTLAEQSKQLEEMLELYHSIDGYNKQYYNDLEKGKQAIDKQLADWTEIKESVDAARRTVQELTISPETQKAFNELVDEAKLLYDKLNDTNNASQEFLISEKLKDVKTELYGLVGGNKELTQIANNVFSSFDKGVNSLLGDVGNLKEAWLSTLDDMQKGSLKNISTMVSALQDLSENKGIAANTFWQLVEFDTEGLLNGAKLVGDRFVITQENMIKLKDKYIQKQIDELRNRQANVLIQKEGYEQDVKQYEMEVAKLTLQKKSMASDEYQTALNNLEKAKRGAKEFGDEWERNNWLIQYLNQTLGNTIDLQKQLEAQQKQLNKELTTLNKELDNYVKAHEKVVDNIIDGLESEQDVLETQKQALQDELDILNEQKDTLEDTIKNYESVNKLVQDTVKKEIDSLEEQKKSIEDTYNKRIEALKAENEEREDALDYAQKLANLENARNNKRRVYDSTRGWRYETVKEDVVKAENDLAVFENEQAIKQLEKERDKETAVIDDIIKEKESYSKEWGDILDLIQTEEDELLAAEILGADWREKIASGDIVTMQKFRTEYLSHNNSLKNLTNTEIKLKQAAIDTKDAEIKSKKEQIDSWKKYKTEIQNAVTDIKNANEEYMKQIGTIELDEGSSLEKREEVFKNFKDKVTGYVNEIAGAQGQLDAIQEMQNNLGGDFDYNIHVNGMEDLEKAMSGTAALAASAALMAGGYNIPQIADDIVGAVSGIWDRLPGFAQGGTIGYTGLAMVHGTPNKKETAFNADDSSKLYKYVHETPNLVADMLSKVSNLTPVSRDTNSSQSVSIGAINVYANNPKELTQGLDKELDNYFRSKLIKSYTQR